MPDLDESELRRQALIALLGLKSAGVDWVPKGAPLPRPTVTPCETPLPVPASPPVLRGRGTGGEGAEPAEDSSFREAPYPPSPQPSPRGVPGGEGDGSLAGLSLSDRRKHLDVLVAEIKTCTRCPELASTRTQTVFGDGQQGAEICFLGEAPGADEDAQGIPFVGAAGQLLNKIIAACGLKREEVYICNILKCRPPGNRTPLPNEADNCSGFLKRQLDIVKPKYIVCLGATAAKYLLNSTKSLGAMRNTFHDFYGIPVIVTYHPAYLLPHRNPAKKKDVWDDMKMLLTKMGRPIPAKKDSEPGER